MKRPLFPLAFIVLAAGPTARADDVSQKTYGAIELCMRTQSRFRTMSGSVTRRPVCRTNDAAKDASRILSQTVVWLEDRGNNRRLLDTLSTTSDGRTYSEKICYDGETSWRLFGPEGKESKQVDVRKARTTYLDEIETHAWALGLKIDRGGKMLTHFLQEGVRDLGAKKIGEADCQGVAFTGKDRERRITGQAWLDPGAGGLPRMLEVLVDGSLFFRCDVQRFVDLDDESHGGRVPFPAAFVCRRPRSDVHFEFEVRDMKINRTIPRWEFQPDHDRAAKGVEQFALRETFAPESLGSVAPIPTASWTPIVVVFAIAAMSLVGICVGVARNPKSR